MARRVLSAAVVGALTVLASGCDGSGGGSPGIEPEAGTPSAVAPTPTPATAGDVSRGAPDPCALLTADEVSAGAGFEASPQGPEEVNDGTGCIWFFSDPSDPTEMGTLTIQVWIGLEYYGPETNPDPAEGEFEPVPGIGDAAHRWDIDGEGDCAIVLRKGEVVVQLVSLYAVEDLCVDLAGVAAGRV